MVTVVTTYLLLDPMKQGILKEGFAFYTPMQKKTKYTGWWQKLTICGSFFLRDKNNLTDAAESALVAKDNISRHGKTV